MRSLPANTIFGSSESGNEPLFVYFDHFLQQWKITDNSVPTLFKGTFNTDITIDGVQFQSELTKYVFDINFILLILNNAPRLTIDAFNIKMDEYTVSIFYDFSVHSTGIFLPTFLYEKDLYWSLLWKENKPQIKICFTR